MAELDALPSPARPTGCSAPPSMTAMRAHTHAHRISNAHRAHSRVGLSSCGRVTAIPARRLGTGWASRQSVRRELGTQHTFAQSIAATRRGRARGRSTGQNATSGQRGTTNRSICHHMSRVSGAGSAAPRGSGQRGAAWQQPAPPRRDPVKCGRPRRRPRTSPDRWPRPAGR